MKKLTRKQALDLLPAVIDNEAAEDDIIAFLAYIESDESVRVQYEQSLRVKRILSQLPRKKAPDDLKDRIMQKLRETEPEFQSPHSGLAEEVVEDDPAPLTTVQPALSRKRELALRYMIGAAVVLFLCLTTIQLLDQTNIPVSFSPHVVEYHSAAHFSDLSGQSLSPHLQTSSPARAEEYIRERFGFDMTVPQLSGAEFAGLFISDFHEGFETPLLEYIQPDNGEKIYIFAFEVDQIDQNRSIKREKKAVETCRTHTDFHISTVDSRDVVSWRWNNNWYTAVSNQNGDDLVSLIEFLD